MTPDRISCGFLPLVDCAPLVVARELGFAAEEGLDLNLMRMPSWSALRDQLAFGVLDAAQMLSPMPVAMSMGLGGAPKMVDVLSVLSVNGDVIGASIPLVRKMRAVGGMDDFADAAAVGRALIAATKGKLRIGVPFPFSMHAELLSYWLNALGLEGPERLDMRTIPPQKMSAAVAADEIDLFCVGEPWGGFAVASGAAERSSCPALQSGRFHLRKFWLSDMRMPNLTGPRAFYALSGGQGDGLAIRETG